MMDNTMRFGTLHPDGSVTNVWEIKQSDIKACPWLIMVPEHYRADGSCRCDDPTHTDMADWGYTWNPETNRWEA